MQKTSKTIVFFGSGPVAAASLRLLVQDFEIEAVITKPRPPHHKGAVPVMELAEELGLTTLFAADKKELDALFETKPVQSEMAVLIDYGIIVSQAIIDYFPLGIVNSHFAVLPEWRGADPITFAVLSGQKSTGVSLMLLVRAMDEGPLIAFGEYEMPADITTPLLTEHLIHFSNELLKIELPKRFDNPQPGEAQTITEREMSYSRKLNKDDSVLDFNKPARVLEREVRAFLDWPRSRTSLNGIAVIITKAHVTEGSDTPGKLHVGGKELGVYCGEGLLMIDELIPAGKKAMSSAAFLAGYHIAN